MSNESKYNRIINMPHPFGENESSKYWLSIFSGIKIVE